jgi:hypothetical protein
MAKRSKIKESSSASEGDEDEKSSRASRAPRPRGLRGRWKAFKTWWRDARRWGLPVLTLLTLLLFTVGVAAVWYKGAFGPDMERAFEGMGGYTSYLFVLGLVLFFGAAYFAAGYILKVREFARLVRTESKSDFIRLQDKIERLAFELGQREQDEVAARKREFRIRH